MKLFNYKGYAALLLGCLLAYGVADGHAQETTSMRHAKVEAVPLTGEIKISIGLGVPPANAHVHLYGVPSSHFVGGQVLMNGNQHQQHVRHIYVLGVPATLRITDLDTGTVATVREGGPELIIPPISSGAQQFGAGVVFPDNYYAGFIGPPHTMSGAHFAGATIGLMTPIPVQIATISGSTINGELTMGLTPVGTFVMRSSEAAHYRGAISDTTWLGTNSGTSPTRFIALQRVATYSSSTSYSTRDIYSKQPLRYVIGY